VPRFDIQKKSQAVRKTRSFALYSATVAAYPTIRADADNRTRLSPPAHNRETKVRRLYFGYPAAHEDDAERAIRAALALTEAVQKLETSAKLPLQVRVGMATGLVVVGDLIGSGAAQEQAVVGETPNLAARLQSLAEPGAVVIASSTRSLTGGLFDCRDLGAVTLKGFAENVSAWQVLGASAAASRFEALRTTTTPFVGREEEIQLLMRRWEQAKQRDGQVVLISGEPGIGKSRIAQAVQERLGTEFHTLLRYFCSPHHQDSAFYPIVTQLERAAGFRRDDSSEERLSKLEAILAQATDNLTEAVPLLAELLSIPTCERYPPLDLTPQKRKERILGAAISYVEGFAAKQPVLLIFEDAHWSDPTTKEWLDLMVERICPLGVLLIVTFRPEFPANWIGRPQVTLINLNRLPAGQREQIILGVIGGKTLPKEVANQIIERTDGIPLFLEELTKAVVESGVLVEAADHYALARPLTRFAIPTSLHASLLARLDRLAPFRQVAQIAAALGRQFSHELISAVAPTSAHRLDEALDQLVRSELIFRRGIPPDAEYTFKHALVQDAAYSTLLKSGRKQIHIRIATTLEGQFPEIVTSQPALLAHHSTEAGLREKAVGYWLKAGQQSVAHSAMTEAVVQLERGVELVGALPDGIERDQREFDLQIALGQALLATKGFGASEPGEVYARARQLGALIGRPSQLGPVLYGQWVLCSGRGQLEKAEHSATEMLHLADNLNDVRWECFGSIFRANSRCYLGEFSDSRLDCETALSLWSPNYRNFLSTPSNQYVHVLMVLSRSLFCLGYLDQARMRRAEALTEARRESPHTLALALTWSCYDCWATEGIKSVQTMLRLSNELLTVSSEQGFAMWFGVGNAVQGGCLVAAHESPEGIPLLRRGIAEVMATGSSLAVPLLLMMMADGYRMTDQPAQGLDRIAEAADFIERTQERWAEAEMHRIRGALLSSMSDHAATEVSYQEALTVARLQSAKFWELRAAMSMARLWRDQGKRDEARDLLAPVYGWFTEGFDTLDLKEAKALLEQLAI
jgi:predicted ATPase